MTDYTIINGPRHGESLKVEAFEDGSVVNVVHFPPLTQNICGDDLPIRYSTPRFVQQFELIGEFAFYLGEDIYISPIIEEAE